MTMNAPFLQRTSVIVMLLVALLSLNAVGEEAKSGAVDPAERIRVLSKKLEALKAEQDFLRFKKTFYETDSKYLVLDPAAGKGMMLCRNRILRTFQLEKINKKAKDPERGIVTMTGKIDGSSRKRSLIFGSSFSFHGKHADIGRSKQTAYRLGTRDLAALYYALEIGSNVYVK